MTWYVYDAFGRLAAEYGGNSVSATSTKYLTADQLGSTRVITDQNQAVKIRRDYLPFGEEIGSAVALRGTIPGYGLIELNTEKFTGKERDTESGLDFFGARYYWNSAGRFTSVDPLGGHIEYPQSLNKYAYVMNNPLKYIDPDGRDFYMLDKEGKRVLGGDACSDGRCDADGYLVVKSSDLSNKESGFSGTVNEKGIQITANKGTGFAGTYSGEFVEGTGGARLEGSGAFEDFSFTIDSKGGDGALAKGTFEFQGKADTARSLLDARGAYRAMMDEFSITTGRADWSGRCCDKTTLPITEWIFHPNSTQHRFGSGPSPHFSVPRGNDSVPTRGEFHVDKHGTGSINHWFDAISHWVTGN